MAHQVLAVARPDDDELRRRVQAVEPELGRHDVAVAREGRAVDEDPLRDPARPEERREQQVEVDAQRVAGRDLGRPRADEPCRASRSGPRSRATAMFVEPAVDAVVRPLVELPAERRAAPHRLRAERLPGKVGPRPPVARRPGSRNRARRPPRRSAASSSSACARAASSVARQPAAAAPAPGRAGSRGDGRDRADRECPGAADRRRRAVNVNPSTGSCSEAGQVLDDRDARAQQVGVRGRAASPSRRCSPSRCPRAPRPRARGGRRRPR